MGLAHSRLGDRSGSFLAGLMRPLSAGSWLLSSGRPAAVGLRNSRGGERSSEPAESRKGRVRPGLPAAELRPAVAAAATTAAAGDLWVRAKEDQGTQGKETLEMIVKCVNVPLRRKGGTAIDRLPSDA